MMIKPDDVRCETCPFWKDEGYYFNNKSGSCHYEFAPHSRRDHLDWCGRHPDFQRALDLYRLDQLADLFVGVVKNLEKQGIL